MRIIAIIQARMSSERLPGKVLKEIQGIPMIQHIVNRVALSKKISEIVVATSKEQKDDLLCQFCQKNSIEVFRGDLNNVLKRYYDCATEKQADIVIRLTGDNALIDAKIIDRAIEAFTGENKCDYMRYSKELPIGMGVEVFTYEALKKAFQEAKDLECKEHVTVYMYRNPEHFECVFYQENNKANYSDLRWTMDTEEDYQLVKEIYDWFGKKEFHYEDIIDAYKKNPHWLQINRNIKQKEVKYNGER